MDYVIIMYSVYQKTVVPSLLSTLNVLPTSYLLPTYSPCTVSD